MTQDFVMIQLDVEILFRKSCGREGEDESDLTIDTAFPMSQNHRVQKSRLYPFQSVLQFDQRDIW